MMTVNSAQQFWIDILTILDSVGVEMESHEADSDIVDAGLDAIISDIRTNVNLAGGKPLRNSWRVKTRDGIVLKLVIEADVTTEGFEVL
jgi:hypothetical protein